MFKFNYKRITDNVKHPKREHKSAGWDMFCSDTVSIPAGIPTIVPTGIKMQYMSEGWVAFLKEKSGLALKRNIEVHGGVIDCDYRGEIKVIVKCDTPTVIDSGSPICQMIFIRIPDDMLVCEVSDEHCTSRMDGGFGSTSCI